MRRSEQESFWGLTFTSSDCDPFESGMSELGKVFTRNDMLRHHFSKHKFLRDIKKFKVGELVEIFLDADLKIFVQISDCDPFEWNEAFQRQKGPCHECNGLVHEPAS
jgi:hypothetical protein